jgi:hypothetical protein
MLLLKALINVTMVSHLEFQLQVVAALIWFKITVERQTLQTILQQLAVLDQSFQLPSPTLEAL